MKQLLFIPAFLIWFVMTVPLGLFGYLTGWLFIPLGLITKYKLFWIWMDSDIYDDAEPNGYAQDYWIYVGYKKPSFWKNFAWVYRQNMWNLKKVLFINAKEKDFCYIYDKLKRNGLMIYDRHYHPVESAGLKFIDHLGNQGWNVNRGEYISKRYSTTGVSFKLHWLGKIPSFRFTCCVKTKLGWLTIKLGDNRKRFVLNGKLQKKIEWK